MVLEQVSDLLFNRFVCFSALLRVWYMYTKKPTTKSMKKSGLCVSYVTGQVASRSLKEVAEGSGISWPCLPLFQFSTAKISGLVACKNVGPSTGYKKCLCAPDFAVLRKASGCQRAFTHLPLVDQFAFFSIFRRAIFVRNVARRFFLEK